MKQIFSTYIYENPLPQLRAMNSMFPYLCELPDGRILASHQMGQAFESVDCASYLSESTDGGKTWSKPWGGKVNFNNGILMSDGGKVGRLPDGRLISFGYAFDRSNPELPLGNPETGGLLDDVVYYCLSEDEGKTWSDAIEVPTAWNGHTEASAPMYFLQDGSWATPITGFGTWEAKLTSRNCGRLLRSFDGGKTWNDDVVCMEFPGDTVTCYEQRMAQTEDGTLIVIGWNEDLTTGERMNNHVTVSTDNGKTFSAPQDMGIRGQASSIMSIGGDKVLSLHCLRRDTDAPGIYACIGEVVDGQWKQISFERIWAPATPMVKNTKMAEIFSFLKFGQPGGILLSNGDLLMCHWVCEEGCYKTVATRFEL